MKYPRAARNIKLHRICVKNNLGRSNNLSALMKYMQIKKMLCLYLNLIKIYVTSLPCGLTTYPWFLAQNSEGCFLWPTMKLNLLAGLMPSITISSFMLEFFWRLNVYPITTQPKDLIFFEIRDFAEERHGTLWLGKIHVFPTVQQR